MSASGLSVSSVVGSHDERATAPPPHCLAVWKFTPPRYSHGHLLPNLRFRVLHFHQPPGTEVTLSGSGDWNWAAGRAVPVSVSLNSVTCSYRLQSVFKTAREQSSAKKEVADLPTKYFSDFALSIQIIIANLH